MSLDAKSLYSNQSRPAHNSEKDFEASLENNRHEQNPAGHCEHCQTNTRNIRLRRLLLATILAVVILGGLTLAWRHVNWYGLSSWRHGINNLVGRDDQPFTLSRAAIIGIIVVSVVFVVVCFVVVCVCHCFTCCCCC